METLGPPSIAIAQGSGVASGGVGLDAGQPMPITLTVPNGASVKQVLVHWQGLSEAPSGPDDTITVNGTEVTGTLIGGPTVFFYSSGGAPVSSTSYRADVTGLSAVQPGANSVSVGGMNFNFANDGASIHAIYDDGSGLADIQLRDGNDVAYRDFEPPLDTTTPQTFTVSAAGTARDANLILAVGSVEPDRPNRIRITAGAEVAVLTNPLGNNDGAEWDHLVLPVVIPAGATTVTVQVLSEDDGSGRVPASLVWVTAMLNVPLAEPPPPCGTSSTPAITHGSVYGVDASLLNAKLVDRLGYVSTVAPGAPASQARQLLTASVPGIVSARVLGTTSNSTLNPSRSTASATVAEVNLLSGLVRATTIRAVSQSVATPNSASFNSNGSTIQGLVVNNVAVNVAPNTKVAVKALGLTVAELAIYEETGTSSFVGGVSKSSHSVNMLRLTLLRPFLGFGSGTQVIVARAESDAQSPTTTCPDARTVSGEAFTAFLDGNLAGTDLVDVKVGEAVLPPTGGSNSDGTTVNVPGAATSTTAFNTTSGSLAPSPNATSRSIVEGANVLNGVVTAQALDVRASSTADGTTAVTTFATTFVNLRVGGIPVTSNPAPNTAFVVNLPGGGFVSVVVNERVVGGNGTSDTEGTVNAIHARVFALGGLLRGEVIVASAHSDAHV